MENTRLDLARRIHLEDTEFGLDGIAQASGARGFSATIAGTGQRFEFTVHEVRAPEPEIPDVPSPGHEHRYFHADDCYGNSDPEIRAMALRKAAGAFPGFGLQIVNSYDVHEANRDFERRHGKDYREQKYAASTIVVRAERKK